MAARAIDPAWRDKAAAELLLRHAPQLKLKGPLLLMGESLEGVAVGLMGLGPEVARWNRRAIGGGSATPWPTPGPYATVAMRLPRSKAELAMNLAAAAGALIPSGTLLLYGAKDEGVGSAPRLMEEFFHEVATAGVGGRCRLLMAKRKESLPELRSSLDRWREVHPLDYPGLPSQWVSYPGVFAQGQLDTGTRLLLDSLPSLDGDAKILDYGCGAGIVGAVALRLTPGAEVYLLDVDSVALEAARENVPEGIFLLQDGLPSVGPEGFDAILTNPPFHRGKGEDVGMIHELIRKAPSVLCPGGMLLLVAQKRLHLEAALQRAFETVSLRAEALGFRVWEGLNPVKGKDPFRGRNSQGMDTKRGSI